MRVISRGDGPPLILIPGIQGRCEWFAPATRALAARCRVATYSLCGDLRSGCSLEASKGFDNYLRQLDDVYERVGPRAALCGISYGGFIALRYAATRPDRVTALILASAPAPGWRPNGVQQAYIEHPWRGAPRFVLTSPFRLAPEILAAFDSWPARVRFGIAQALRVAAAPMLPGLMAARILEQQSLDFAPDAAAVHAPTLVITGEPHLDRVVPVESTRRYLEMIRGAEYALLPRTGHLGLVTRPVTFASIVANFLDRQSKTAALR